MAKPRGDGSRTKTDRVVRGTPAPAPNVSPVQRKSTPGGGDPGVGVPSGKKPADTTR